MRITKHEITSRWDSPITIATAAAVHHAKVAGLRELPELTLACTASRVDPCLAL